MKTSHVLKKSACIALSAALLLPAVPAFAADGTTKDETVYVFLNPDGTVTSQTVSSWVHSDGGIRSVREEVALQNIRNVKNAAAPQLDGGVLTWDMDGNDAYYTGTSDKTPPVTAAISYKLDGEDVCFEVYSLRKTDVGTWAHDKAELSQEFTVDYHNQHPEDSFPLINVNVAPPEERASQERRSELHDRAENADADERAAIDEELRALEAEDIARDQANWAQFENPSEREKASTKNLFYAEVDAAHKLEQATLIVQATFSDGSAAEKRYRIAPIDDFEWTLLKRWEAQGQPEDDPRLTAPLFTITELD